MCTKSQKNNCNFCLNKFDEDEESLNIKSIAVLIDNDKLVAYESILHEISFSQQIIEKLKLTCEDCVNEMLSFFIFKNKIHQRICKSEIKLPKIDQNKYYLKIVDLKLVWKTNFNENDFQTVTIESDSSDDIDNLHDECKPSKALTINPKTKEEEDESDECKPYIKCKLDSKDLQNNQISVKKRRKICNYKEESDSENEEQIKQKKRVKLIADEQNYKTVDDKKITKCYKKVSQIQQKLMKNLESTLTEIQMKDLENKLTKTFKNGRKCCECGKSLGSTRAVLYHLSHRHILSMITSEQLWVSKKLKEGKIIEKDQISWKCCVCYRFCNSHPSLRYHLQQHWKDLESENNQE